MAIATLTQTTDELPADLAAVVEHQMSGGRSEAEVLRSLFTSPGIPSAPDLPAGAAATWADEHSPFAYLGRAGVLYSEVPDWGAVALGHLKFDHAFPGEPTEDNPTGEHLPVLFLDNHVEFLTRARAEQIIAESTTIFEALATGAPLPDHYQVEADLSRIGSAIRAYAKAHNNTLPPDLGSTLAYMPAVGRRGATPAQRARCYLAPRAARNTHIPDAPDAEWINRNTSYAYLAADVPLAEVDDAARLLLLSAKPGFEILRPRDHNDHDQKPLTPALTVSGASQLLPRGYADTIIPESRAVFDAIRTGKPLPDYHHTLRDLRILWSAIQAYAKDNNGSLPPDLASTLPYLSEGRSDHQIMALYLSPKAERTRGQLPDALDPNWINETASYRYLGNAQLSLADVRGGNQGGGGGGRDVILHAPLDEPYPLPFPNDVQQSLIPYAGRHRIQAMPREFLEERIAEERTR